MPSSQGITMESQPLLISGRGGYHTYRIPAAVRTSGGTVLLFCEGRKRSSSDFGQIHMLLTRSTDNGRTWSEPAVVWKEGGANEEVSVGNPCPVVDRETGQVWLVFTRDNQGVFATSSADDGKTWGRPRDITNDVRPASWTRYWVGPGHGIQLRHGAKSGRLLFPSYHLHKDDQAGRLYMRSHSVYSDDHGTTWKIGQGATLGKSIDEVVFTAGWVPEGFVWAGCECLAEELHDGELYMAVRNQVRLWGRKAFARSSDGGETWTPLGLHPDVPGLKCQSGLTRVDAPGEPDADWLLQSGIAESHEGKGRRNLTVFLSRDGGWNWQASKLLHEGPAAYSDLCALPNGEVLCFYEGGERAYTESICVARFRLDWLRSAPADPATGADATDYDIELSVATKLFDGKRCWCHPRAGIVPGAGNDGLPRVVMTMNTLHLSGSDVFKGMYGLRTDDLGRHWTEARELRNLAPRHEVIDGQKRPVAVSDCWPAWHAASGKLLGTGHTVVYTPDWHVRNPRPRHVTFSVYDPASDDWSPWHKLEMPDPVKFCDAGAGCTQRVDVADGTILLPIYFRPPGKNARTTVLRCSFDGETLRYVEHGDELVLDDKTRGLGEPSLARVGSRYFLTIRNDLLGYVTRGNDGLHFEPYRPWTFDDGKELGSYNTQQHWVTHADSLFLVYTRRGASNDHVFRHRAPLFVAEVDQDRLCVLRKTERVIVPGRGARLGNFGVTHVSDNETWVTVAEWMQPRGCERHGSNGSVFVARLLWTDRE